MKLVVEYLVIIDKKVSEGFFKLCDSVEEFNRFLQKDRDLDIQANTIKFKQDLQCDYEAKAGEVEGRDQRFFHIKFEFNGDEDKIDDYTKLLRTVRGIIHGSGGQPETLWDDISFYYSQKSYPLIHKIENLMRKLITRFMLTNIGKEWISESLPPAIQEAINKSKRKQYLDVLHQIDFKDLGDILFKTYQKGSIRELYDKIDGSESLEDLDLEDLSTYVPRSNWERYFSSIVACDDVFLKKRWLDLYDLRCMVAHNALVTKTEYENIEKLVQDVQEKLQKAIDNLDKIEVPEEDKEELAESVASNLNVLYGNFIQSWKLFESDLEKIVNYLGLDLESVSGLKSSHKTIQLLHKNAVIDDEMFSEAKYLMQFRNKLVYDPTISLGEQEISDYIVRQKDFINELKKLSSGRSTWKNELVNVLRNFGGKASLSEIYNYIEQNTVRELPTTWKATVRYTLQLNSSDTETYSRGGEDLFERLERGIWSLKKGVEENNNGDNDGDGEQTGKKVARKKNQAVK